jgi:UDP-glucuronate decarboxylase
VYGDPTVHPQPESYWGNVNPIGPRSCYDEGKRVAETLFMDYHREDKADIRIARIFNTYGPRMAEADGRVVSNFIVQALRGKELTIFGAGQQTRSFCYVDDLVEGLLRLMAAEGRHEPVNLGNPVEFTIRQLADEVARTVGKEVRLVYQALPQDDPTQRKPDITRAREWLGWEPTVPLAAGLEKTVGYFREKLRMGKKSRKREGPVHGSSRSPFTVRRSRFTGRGSASQPGHRAGIRLLLFRFYGRTRTRGGCP